MRDQALEYLHRELRKAKQAYGQAEHRPGVAQEELDNLQRKIDVLDYMVPMVLAGEETGWPVWALKMALVKVRDVCAAKWVDCTECPLFDQDAFECPIQNRFPSNWEVDCWKEDQQ